MSAGQLLALLQSPLSLDSQSTRRGLSSTYSQLQNIIRQVLPVIALVLTTGVFVVSPVTCIIPAVFTDTSSPTPSSSSWIGSGSATSDHIVNYCTQDYLSFYNFLYLLWIESVVLILPSFLYMNTVGQDMYTVVYDLDALAGRLLVCMQEHTEDPGAEKLAKVWVEARALTESKPQQQQASVVELQVRDDRSGDEEQRHLIPQPQAQPIEVEADAPETVASMMRDPYIRDTFKALSKLYAPSWSKRWWKQLGVCPDCCCCSRVGCPCV